VLFYVPFSLPWNTGPAKSRLVDFFLPPLGSWAGFPLPFSCRDRYYADTCVTNGFLSSLFPFAMEATALSSLLCPLQSNALLIPHENNDPRLRPLPSEDPLFSTLLVHLPFLSNHPPFRLDFVFLPESGRELGFVTPAPLLFFFALFFFFFEDIIFVPAPNRFYAFWKAISLSVVFSLSSPAGKNFEGFDLLKDCFLSRRKGHSPPSFFFFLTPSSLTSALSFHTHHPQNEYSPSLNFSLAKEACRVSLGLSLAPPPSPNLPVCDVRFIFPVHFRVLTPPPTPPGGLT